jgi:dTDP-glucose 4,6-dehydratase
MNIVVTGGAGFIGSELVRQLVRETQHEVTNIDCLTYASCAEALADVASNPRYRFERVDIRNRTDVRDVLEACRPDGIIHLAAETHVDRSIDSPDAFIETNVNGTLSMLQESYRFWATLDSSSRSRFKVCHVSTDEVFGQLGSSGCFTERSPYAPRSPYAASKAASDHLVRAWHHTYGLPVTILHCSNTYGPFQFPEKLVPLTITKAVQGHALPLYGDGQHVRQWLHVADCARGIRLAFEHTATGESYCLGGNRELTNQHLVEAICEELDRILPDSPWQAHASLITHVADRPGHDRRYAVSSSKAEQTFGWKPTTTLEKGLHQTVQWYVGRRSWWEAALRDRYRGERLGLGNGAG